MSRGDFRRNQQEAIVVNIYEAGPFEGRLEQWPVLATSGALEVRLAETEGEVEQAGGGQAREAGARHARAAREPFVRGRIVLESQYPGVFDGTPAPADP